MKTITVIDLLNKIANGEEVPKKIIYNKSEYVYDNNVMDYYLNEDSYLNSYNNDYYLFENELNHTGLCQGLNDEVEIIEDAPKEEKKIPEKIKDKYCSQISKVELAQKYNQLIDYLKSKGE